jgi:16S rRNA (guanine527-N7)-methyltransferase
VHPSRIAELLEPFLRPADDERLTTNDLQSISTYIDLLLRWNARINLTAIRDPEQIVTRHFGESLFLARHLFPRPSSVPSVVKDSDFDPAPTLADIGSGAGFPGIPLKLWAPEISLTLIESNHKKATFLREVARALPPRALCCVTKLHACVTPRPSAPH